MMSEDEFLRQFPYPWEYHNYYKRVNDVPPDAPFSKHLIHFLKKGHDGDFAGHGTGALFNLALGLFWSLYALKKVRGLKEPGETFCSRCVPVASSRLLFVHGVCMVVVNALGFAVDNYAWCYRKEHHWFGWGCTFKTFAHKGTYLCSGFIGVVQIIESCGRLPLDTWRAFMGLCFVGICLVWYRHAVTKRFDQSVMVHLNIFRSYAMQVVCIWASCYYKDNTTLFLAGMGGCFFLAAASLVTAGLYATYEVILPEGKIGTIYAFEILAITIGMVVVGANFGSKGGFREAERDHYRRRRLRETTEFPSLKYEEVSKNDLDDDDDDLSEEDIGA